MQKNIKEILEILRYALKAETKAFTDYYNGSKKVDIPEIKGILLYLAEEERKHRILLLNEYNNLKNYGLNEIKGIQKKHEIRFKIPKNYTLKTLQTIPEIDISGVSLPTEIVGGDYLDTFSIKDDKKGICKLGIILYDAMGHGLSATHTKSITRAIFQKFREDFYNKSKNIKIFNPYKIVTEINREITRKCQKAGSFVTLFYCVIDPEKGEITYTSAGHEPPIYIGTNTDSVEQLATTQLLLGFDENIKYTENKIKINSGDIFVLFTDGIIEAVDSNGNMFGREKIVKTLMKNRNKSSSQILDKIIESLKNHIGKKFVYDEISLLVVKANSNQK